MQQHIEQGIEPSIKMVCEVINTPTDITKKKKRGLRDEHELTVNPLEIKAVSNRRSTALKASGSSGQVLDATCNKHRTM